VLTKCVDHSTRSQYLIAGSVKGHFVVLATEPDLVLEPFDKWTWYDGRGVGVLVLGTHPHFCHLTQQAGERGDRGGLQPGAGCGRYCGRALHGVVQHSHLLASRLCHRHIGAWLGPRSVRMRC
jgi:hypothetical protein